MPIEGWDYFVQVMPFGVPVPAFTRMNPDGYTFTLYLNSEYDWEHRLDSYEHELWHLIRDDFYGDKDIRDIENLKRSA